MVIEFVFDGESMKSIVLTIFSVLSWRFCDGSTLESNHFNPRKVSSDFLKNTLLKEISSWSENDHGDRDISSDNKMCKLHMLSLFRHITQPNVLRRKFKFNIGLL